MYFRRRRRAVTQYTVKALTGKERMKCMKCGKNFQKYENFEAHMRSHFGKKVSYYLQRNVIILKVRTVWYSGYCHRHNYKLENVLPSINTFSV